MEDHMDSLTAEELRKILFYNPATGFFVWRQRPPQKGFRNSYVGSRAGQSQGRYRAISINGRFYKEHRLAWLYVNGEWSTLDVDHINGDSFDNRISNLRPATKSQNIANRRLNKSSKTGLKGVSFFKRDKVYIAQIMKDGKSIYLGRHKTAEEAHLAYCEAATRLFGEFARTA